MKNFLIYQYPKCSTCRKAIKFLKDHEISFKEIDITEQPPKKTELKKMLHYYDGDIKKLFNTSGVLYREMKLSKKVPTMTEQEAIDLLSQHGKLIKRPFILTPDRGLIGFKEEQWSTLL